MKCEFRVERIINIIRGVAEISEDDFTVNDLMKSIKKDINNRYRGFNIKDICIVIEEKQITFTAKVSRKDFSHVSYLIKWGNGHSFVFTDAEGRDPKNPLSNLGHPLAHLSRPK